MQSVLKNLDEVTAVLRASQRLGKGEYLRPLTGGVSALVAVVEGGESPWIVKVPLGQLTVRDEWLVDRARGANEAAILEVVWERLGSVRTPRLLFFDATHVMLGEEYVIPPSVNYKDELLAGRTHPLVARALGGALGRLHELAPPPSLEGPGPRELFDTLRLDPYYRTTAQRRPDLADALDELVADTIEVTPRSLVHGDVSPKNILVTSTSPVLLDWEVIHCGDPAFDCGMMSAHYALKAILHGDTTMGHALVEEARQFWRGYDGPASVERSLRHAGGVILARLYGKSRVEYLNDERARSRAHRVGERALRGDVTTIDAWWDLLDEE